MATNINLKPDRTYANIKNLETAIGKYPRIAEDPNLRYLVLTTPEGRVYPVFLGEYAIQNGIHFLFCVAG